uniref:Uncharacterized protein n=1 Tax=Timspurckia oligopyrenoides TaxID=708627 RepID=A0A7S1EPV8_9RHOD|mmetsp:Transcript_11295/g.20421  ORF Transcript_11295/g.20421 Transcript_11295/m.20421 type:complete len:100 (+) Transcript_11295:507-806(+)
MFSYRLVIRRWCELYSSDFDPVLWNFGDTPADIVKLFGSASQEKARHVELMKLKFIRDSVEEHTRERFRMSRLKHRKIPPEITSAWKTLVERMIREETV